jgi:CTP:molybdopterin cytidylyltransferase MocA
VSAAAAVVLAAGAASRFGAPKQVILLPRVLVRLEVLLTDGTLSEIVVVEGAHRIPPGTAGAARLVACPAWADGPGASLRAGLGALGPGVEAAVVVLADGPGLASEAVRRVLAARGGAAVPVVAASYAGVRGHPLVVGREAWDGIPDCGLRGVEPLLVPCDDLGAPGDIDTPADLIESADPPDGAR